MTQDRHPLLLIHGLGGSARWWRRVEGRGRRVEIVEFRRPRQLALEEPSVVVGHSLGGLLAAQLAAADPGHVRALVLVAPVGAPRSPAGYAVGLAEALRSAPAPLLRTIVGDALRWGVPALARGAWTATRASFEEHVEAPTLLVWGERDRLVPVSLAAEWQKPIPHAELVVLRGVGHVPMLEAPSAFNEALHGFLDGLGV